MWKREHESSEVADSVWESKARRSKGRGEVAFVKHASSIYYAVGMKRDAVPVLAVARQQDRCK